MEDDLQRYRCTAISRSIGYEQEDEDSPIYQWNGEDCVLEEGTIAYTAMLPDDDRNWLRLFAVPDGHGSTYLGFHKRAHFELEKIAEGET